MKNNIHYLVFRMILLCTALLLASTVTLTAVLFWQSNLYLKRNALSMVVSSGRQIEMNSSNYFEDVENAAALLFSDEDFYQYDGSVESEDEYSRIQSENKILDEIVNIGMMENFSDFGIVYRNDRMTGWISQVTMGMFPQGGLYDEFEASIVNEKTRDGWSFGHEGNMDRLYYVKELNPNAILIASFYSSELEHVFEVPEQFRSMDIRLTDEKDRILYSTNTEEIGTGLTDDIASLVKKSEESGSAQNKDLIVTSNVCSNGWHVVCSIGVAKLLSETERFRSYVMFAVFLLSICFLGAAVFLFHRFTRPMVGMVNTLNQKAEHDELSGLLNRSGFRSVINAGGDAEQMVSCVMLDFDHFKEVNDTLGHDAGDEIIRRFGRMLMDIFPERVPVCRLGGDEFAIWMSGVNTDSVDAEKTASAFLLRLFEVFRSEFQKEHEATGLSLSAGVCTAAASPKDYPSLLKRADEALYESKRAGKDRVSYVR